MPTLDALNVRLPLCKKIKVENAAQFQTVPASQALYQEQALSQRLSQPTGSAFCGLHPVPIA